MSHLSQDYEPLIQIINEHGKEIVEAVYPCEHFDTPSVFDYHSPDYELMAFFDAFVEGKGGEKEMYNFLIEDTQPVVTKPASSEKTGKTFSHVETEIFSHVSFDHYIAPSEGTIYRAARTGKTKMSVVFIEGVDDDEEYRERISAAAYDAKVALHVETATWDTLPRGRLYLGANGQRLSTLAGEAVGIELNPYVAADLGLSLCRVEEIDGGVEGDYSRNGRITGFKYMHTPDYFRYPGDLYAKEFRKDTLFDIVSTFPLRTLNNRCVEVDMSRVVGLGLDQFPLWNEERVVDDGNGVGHHIGFKVQDGCRDPVIVLDDVNLHIKKQIFHGLYGYDMPSGGSVLMSMFTNGYHILESSTPGYRKVDLGMSGRWYYSDRWRFFLGRNPFDPAARDVRAEIKRRRFPHLAFVDENLCVTGFVESLEHTTYVYLEGGPCNLKPIRANAVVKSSKVSFVGPIDRARNMIYVKAVKSYDRAQGGTLTVVDCGLSERATSFSQANRDVFDRMWYGDAVDGEEMYSLIYDGLDHALTATEKHAPCELYKTLRINDYMKHYERYERAGNYLYVDNRDEIEFDDMDELIIQ